MATLNCFFHLMMAFMLHSSLLLTLFLYFSKRSAALDIPKCKRADPKESPQSTFELFHMHGPCSPTTEMNMPSTKDILEGDQLRVDISCNSSECTQLLPERTCVNFNNRENTCSYDIQHVDGSHDAKGVLSMDNLKITETDDVFRNWTFFCATEIDDNKNFKVVAGVLGLARNSFVKQIEQTYGGMFSYCIPSDSSKTGFLKLGTRDYPKTVNFTPFITNSDHPSFYFINITSLSVGGAQLSLNPSDLLNPGTIIDSRVSITRLPLNVYVMIRNEFRDQMKVLGYFKRDAYDMLDTCYDTRTYPNITTPNITFTFNGDVTLNFGASVTIYAINSTLKCFAFAGNSGVGDNLAIIGNTHQKNLEVVFDVDGGKLGFVPDRC
ncbi:hypothetical protein CASFOL_041755 [Castilleja foliolosa]|uniref:Peptidase A1 domain-containing protein n=1 Tax=Castilleja foliolosa TaxID=1961234 RepID=A0ABD3B9B6_9LAMI